MLPRVPIELRTVLDPRSPEEAARNPIMHAVNIPFGDLAGRTHELPPSSEVVQVADVGLPGAQTVDWLIARGRQAALTSHDPGPFAPNGRLWSPNAFLEEVSASLVPGLALDLGCGSGREAVYLASMGWQVRAIDLLPDAIERGQALQARYPDLDGRIDWEAADLSKGNPLRIRVDLITMFFFLDREALCESAKALKQGGSVVLETFSPLHRERFGKPHSPNLALSLGDAPSLLPTLMLRRLDADWRPNGRHTTRAWWTRA